MSATFRPAVRENEPIRLGIAGPSRAGKTFSALSIAKGMAEGDMSKVYGLDTERPGLTFYADQFPGFQVARLEPPFSPQRYREIMRAAAAAGAKVLIVDSASHEHEGEGGVLMMQEAELDRMAGDDYGRREKMKFAAWIKPKAEHNLLVQEVLQLGMHTIFCFRAKQKLKLVRGPRGVEPVSMGWQPIITSGFEFEMTSLIILAEGAKGVPDLTAQASSFREPLDRMVLPGKPLGEDLGRKLAAWSMGQAKQANQGTVALNPSTGEVTVLPAPFVIRKFKGDTPCGDIGDWQAKMMAAIKVLAPDRAAAFLNLNESWMESYAREHAEAVALVRDAFAMKLETPA